MKPFAAIAALATALLLAAQTEAATIGLAVEGGGSPQVYQLSNGNFLGLWGLDNRERANPGGAVTITTQAELLSAMNPGSRNRVVAVYNGTNPVNSHAREFSPLVYDFTVGDEVRLSNALWIEWRGGNLVYRNPGRGGGNMGATATRTGDPFLVTTPLPGALPLLLAGFAALGLAARRRKAV